jgi:hypothetical protein
MNPTEGNWPSVLSAAIRRVAPERCVEPPGLRRTGSVAPGKVLIPVVLLVWLGLGIPTGLPLQAAPAEPEAASPVATHTADLQYQETDEVLVSFSVGVKLLSNPFLKEPPPPEGDAFRSLPRANVFRGSLLSESRPEQATAFIWDKAQGRLYLDLNRNGDLTDDPKGIFASPSRDDNQTFTNVHLVLPTATGDRAVRLQLEFYSSRSSSPRVSAGLCYYWDTKLSLRGTDWQFGLVEGRLRENAYLLLRPWAERQRPFHLTTGSPDFFGFTTDLFFGNQAYTLDCRYQPGGDSGKYRLTLKEQSPRLGELKVTGADLHRLILTTKPSLTVVLDQPQGTVRVPVGNYSLDEIWLRQGEVEVGSFGAGKVSVDARRPANLVAGGSLTNSVTVKSQDHSLRLKYKMLGADGRDYKFPRPDYKHPPEFAVFQGTNRLATGKFEFG